MDYRYHLQTNFLWLPCIPINVCVTFWPALCYFLVLIVSYQNNYCNKRIKSQFRARVLSWKWTVEFTATQIRTLEAQCNDVAPAAVHISTSFLIFFLWYSHVSCTCRYNHRTKSWKWCGAMINCFAFCCTWRRAQNIYSLKHTEISAVSAGESLLPVFCGHHINVVTREKTADRWLDQEVTQFYAYLNEFDIHLPRQYCLGDGPL